MVATEVDALRPAPTLQEAAVAPVPRPFTPETPVVRGSWNIWPVLRDPETPGAIEAGELDDRVHELRDVAFAHGADRVCQAANRRISVLRAG